MSNKKQVVFGMGDDDLLDYIEGKKFSTYVKELIKKDMLEDKEAEKDMNVRIDRNVRKILELLESKSISFDNDSQATPVDKKASKSMRRNLKDMFK